MLKKRLLAIIILLLISMLFLLGAFSCQADKNPNKPTTNLILATTTSLQDSGLLDDLIPVFEKQYPYKVKTLALGTGEALATAARGEADVLLVHAPKAELKFIAQGYGINRRNIAYNYFVIIGPKKDPAGVVSAKDADEAFHKIANHQALFISRADQSGTNKREISIWQKAGLKPSGRWYMEAGQGMGKTLQLAGEKQAYTLSDSATFIAMRDRLDLKIILRRGPDLKNVYSVIEVNPAKLKDIKVNSRGAKDFSRFLRSTKAGKIIADFGRKKYGRPLFFLLNKER